MEDGADDLCAVGVGVHEGRVSIESPVEEVDQLGGRRIAVGEVVEDVEDGDEAQGGAGLYPIWSRDGMKRLMYPLASSHPPLSTRRCRKRTSKKAGVSLFSESKVAERLLSRRKARRRRRRNSFKQP